MTIDTSPDALERLAKHEYWLDTYMIAASHIADMQRALLAVAAEKRASQENIERMISERVSERTAQKDVEILKIRQAHDNWMAELQSDLSEIQKVANLRWESDQRAIKIWQDATGRTLEWPDHADLCVWLLERLCSQQPTVPPGYVLVPVEPTEEMLSAVTGPAFQEEDVIIAKIRTGRRKKAAKIWNTMLAAAPKQENQP